MLASRRAPLTVVALLVAVGALLVVAAMARSAPLPPADVGGASTVQEPVTEQDLAPEALLDLQRRRIRVAIGPDGGWVALRGSEYYAEGVPDELRERLRQLSRQGKRFDAVAIGPDRSWTVVADDAHWTRGIPDEPLGYFASLQELIGQGRQVRAVAFNPDTWSEHHGFVIAHDEGFVARYVPDEMRRRLEEISRAVGIDAVAFAPNGGWVVAGGENVWSRGTSERLLDILIETIDIDERLDAVTFDPRDRDADRGWLVVGASVFAADDVPATLTDRLQRSWPGRGDVLRIENGGTTVDDDADGGATDAGDPSGNDAGGSDSEARADADTAGPTSSRSTGGEIDVRGVVGYDHALDSGSFAEFFPGKVRNVIVESALDRDGDGAVSGFDIRFQADMARFELDHGELGRKVADTFLKLASLLPGVPSLPKFRKPPAMAPKFCLQAATSEREETVLTNLSPAPPARPASMDFVIRFGVVQSGPADRSYSMQALINRLESERDLTEFEVKTSYRALEDEPAARKRAQKLMDRAFGSGQVTVTGDPGLDESLEDPCGMGASSATLSIDPDSPLRLERPEEDGVFLR